MAFRKALLSSLFYFVAQAQSEQDRRLYPDLAEIADVFGYGWEAHKVETEDGWFLTLFRITSVDGERLSTRPENRDKPPLLMQHGASGNGHGWIGGLTGALIPGKLAEQGYDVWLGNNRGTMYSNVHKNDGQPGWTLKDHWNFSWADMG